MRRQHPVEPSDLLHFGLESKEGWGSGITFVSLHDSSPLSGTHGAGATVGQIDTTGDVEPSVAATADGNGHNRAAPHGAAPDRSAPDGSAEADVR